MRELSEKEILDHVGEVAENGYSIIENAIEQDYIKEILQELERLEAVRPGGEFLPRPSEFPYTKVGSFERWSCM